jgi:hypothetical protein
MNLIPPLCDNESAIKIAYITLVSILEPNT